MSLPGWLTLFYIVCKHLWPLLIEDTGYKQGELGWLTEFQTL